MLQSNRLVLQEYSVENGIESKHSDAEEYSIKCSRNNWQLIYVIIFRIFVELAR